MRACYLRSDRAILNPFIMYVWKKGKRCFIIVCAAEYDLVCDIMGLRWFISFKSCENIALHYLAGVFFFFLFVCLLSFL